MAPILTVDEILPMVDDFALIGVHPRPVPVDLLLRALLAQRDHYVSEEMGDVQEALGVEAKMGFAIVTSGEVPLAVLPPTVTHRQKRLTHFTAHAYFWATYAEKTRPWLGKVERCEEIVAPIRLAIARWSTEEEPYRWHEDEAALDNSTKSYRTAWGFVAETREQLVERHVGSFLEGKVHGIVAVALGRIIDPDIVVAVEETRWMFDLSTAGASD